MRGGAGGRKGDEAKGTSATVRPSAGVATVSEAWSKAQGLIVVHKAHSLRARGGDFEVFSSSLPGRPQADKYVQAVYAATHQLLGRYAEDGGVRLKEYAVALGNGLRALDGDVLLVAEAEADDVEHSDDSGEETQEFRVFRGSSARETSSGDWKVNEERNEVKMSRGYKVLH